MAVASVIWIATGRASNPRFGDGSFALTWHFPRVLAESLGRLLFVWGLLALAALAIFRAREYLRLTIYSFVWMILGLDSVQFPDLHESCAQPSDLPARAWDCRFWWPPRWFVCGSAWEEG